MGFARKLVFSGLLGTSTAAAYLAAANPVVAPLDSSDPVWSSSVYKRANPARNPCLQDVVIKRIPFSRIRPELLKKDGDLALEFCRGVWGGYGYDIQRRFLEYKYRNEETAKQLWDHDQLVENRYDKGTIVTDHFEVVEKTPTSIAVRCGDSPRNSGPRPSDGLFFISATIDRDREEVELRLKSVFFSSEGKIDSKRHPMPGWMEELHQWYSRVLCETASWRLLRS